MTKFLIAAAVLLVPVGCARNSENPAGHIQVSGTWQLNEKESQNPLALLGGTGGGFGATPRGEGPPIAMPPGGTPAGAGGTRAPSRARIDEARAKNNAVQQKLELFADMQRKLTIQDNGATINIDYAIGPQLRYFTHKSSTDSIPVIGILKSDAEWTETGLVVNHKIGDFKMREEYTRNIGATRLVVYTKVTGLVTPLEYRRVYDRE
jgi:hypothetical protein